MTSNKGAILSAKIHTLLLTGAAGGLGQALRPRLAPFCQQLRLSDLTPIHDLADHEHYIAADLSQANSVLRLCEGVDAIIHLGGISLEGPFEPILQANILGSYHLYEAARLYNISRIIFASSNHVTGFYEQGQTISSQSPRRPDGYYGVSKSFTEDLASFYYDRYGIETLSVRIGSSFPEPKDRRMLSTWLSYDDLTRLIVTGLHTPNIKHQVVYGVSDNSPIWWLKADSQTIPFKAQDSSAIFRTKIEKQALLPADHPQRRYQGGHFTALGPYPFPTASPIEARACVYGENQLGESPVWGATSGYVYWVDIELARLHAYHPITKTHHFWQTEHSLSAAFEDPNRLGSMWICAHDGIYSTTLDWNSHNLQLTPIAPFEAPTPHMRLNDAIMDSTGRIWVTTLHTINPQQPDNPGLGALYCWDPLYPSQLRPHINDLKIGNGLAINPEQDRLYLSDSHPSRRAIYCFSFNVVNGNLSNQTLFATLTESQGRPDGAAMDELGGYWVCGMDAGLVHRFLPTGQLERSIHIPSPFPTKACFGQHDLSTLYLTSKSSTGDAKEVVLFELNPGVKGINWERTD